MEGLAVLGSAPAGDINKLDPGAMAAFFTGVRSSGAEASPQAVTESSHVFQDMSGKCQAV